MYLFSLLATISNKLMFMFMSLFKHPAFGQSSRALRLQTDGKVISVAERYKARNVRLEIPRMSVLVVRTLQ